jgi:hypothetical protein
MPPYYLVRTNTSIAPFLETVVLFHYHRVRIHIHGSKHIVANRCHSKLTTSYSGMGGILMFVGNLIFRPETPFCLLVSGEALRPYNMSGAHGAR